jgi:predicted aldo/keto reductase-like oxidoreductase
MKEEQDRIDRRNFLKTVGAAGLGSILASAEAMGDANEPGAGDPNTPKEIQKPEFLLVPRRKLGKLTERNKDGKKVSIEVPILSFGTFRVDTESQILLRRMLQYGINFWDTAYNYQHGNSELGIGKFISRHPKLRKALFIASKASHTQTIEDVEHRLQTSLKRMKTDYIDLYYLHEVEERDRLNNELRDWAKDAKDRGLIRFFGFTVHRDMTECLNVGARLKWIDAILTLYNFRLMQDKKLNAAMDACHKAGIALIAMKIHGKGQVKDIETEGDKKLTQHFLKRGFTPGQAKLKVVLTDKRICSACIGMQNVRLLDSNVAAVLDKTKLTPKDIKLFKKVSQETCNGYCAGCARICGAAVADGPYVSEVMRYLMYYNSYGEQEVARELFAQIPQRARARLARADYRVAEARCPQHMPIGRLMAEAVSKLA